MTQKKMQFRSDKPTGEWTVEEVQAMRERLRGIEEVEPSVPHKPTGEWTAEMVEATLKDRPFAASTIASKHNAALAAEHKKANTFIEASGKALRKYDNQLAAEHKGWERADKALTILHNENEKLEKQLAAERKNAAQLARKLAAERDRYASLEKSILDLSHPNCKDLLQQLAAERIYWTELRDLLHLPSTDNDKALVIHEIMQLRDQLAAERKNAAQLARKLAAEREK